ncbi:MAG: CPBP family intramembrane metalloprotease [Clostridia bacterium]|nr:CPBP family intramembrane metalloprotease [Clostridia bacterium]
MDITAKREENSYFLARSLADIRHDLAVVFAAACVMLILLYACGGLQSLLPMWFPALGAEWFNVTLQLVFYVLSLAVPMAAVALCARRRPEKLFPLKAVMPQKALQFFLLAAGATYSVNFLCGVLLAKFYPPAGDESYTTSYGAILAVVMIVLIAPFLEELFFRGAVFGTLAGYSPVFAAIVSATVFGLSHRNPPQVINAFVMGLFLALAFIKTGSAAACVFMHLINNAVSVIAQFAAYRADEEAYVLMLGLGITAVAAFSAVIIVKALVTRRRAVTAFDDPVLASPRFPARALAKAVFGCVPFWIFILLVGAGVWMLYL